MNVKNQYLLAYQYMSTYNIFPALKFIGNVVNLLNIGIWRHVIMFYKV